MARWQDHFLGKFGLVAGSNEAADVMAGSSKHSRQRQKPKDYVEKKRAKKAAAKAHVKKMRHRADVQKRHRRAYKAMRAKG